MTEAADILAEWNQAKQNGRALANTELARQFNEWDARRRAVTFRPTVQERVAEKMRQFETGATRDTDEGKLDYEGFLSPLVLQRFAQYMHKNRIQSDGSLRSADNWQKGIPPPVYMSSLWRHFMDAWLVHREWANRPELTPRQGSKEQMQEALCAVLFNAMGYLHELLKEQ